MANPEHLKILKQGVEVWNEWQEKHPNVLPDLSEADLRWVNLSTANLLGADLFETNLKGADLSSAKLLGADLFKANLNWANLNWADLSKANLSEANLNGATLNWANLVEANLKGADLSGSDLKWVDLRWADLLKVKLIGANLSGADLRWATLEGADLREVDLELAKLIQTNLSETIITSACLYGTARDEWCIDGIECDYVIWDSKPSFSNEGEKTLWKQEHRIPKDRSFRPGEFEQLYKQLPSFKYYFEHGFTPLDAVVMARIVQAINADHPEFDLKLDSFHSRGQPYAKFTVVHKQYVEKARKKTVERYETRISVLEGRIDQIEHFFSAFIEQPKVQQEVFINQLALTEKGDVTMGDTTNIGHDNISIDGNARVDNLTTGASIHGDHAQQFLNTVTPDSSRDDILKLLAFVQQELPKLDVPEEVKDEVANEVKGAEIQAKKEAPDKKKIGEKLQNATEALEHVPKLTKSAVTIGNLLGQAILWCGMKWVEWRYGG